MYRELTATDLKKDLNLPDDYKVDAVILTGATNVHSLRDAFDTVIKANYPNAIYEEPFIKQGLYSFVKSIVIDNKRIWFDVVYGGAYLSELLHIACLFGSKKNLFFGTCGGLQKTLQSNDIILPTKSYGNESTTRAYWKSDTSEYEADIDLLKMIEHKVKELGNIHSGKILTYQAMLGETMEDIIRWESEGYLAVEMETSTFFSVSKHFNVPAAAVLQVADNLAHKQTVLSNDYKKLKETRHATRAKIIEILLTEALA